MRPAALLLAATLLALTAAAPAQWTLQPSPTTADLRGIDNVGNGIAWASGTHGTILRTTDSGLHWRLCTTPPNAAPLDFRGIQAFDATTAIAMSSGPGDLSRLYKTTDACQTWTLLFTNPDKTGFWDALRFDEGSDNGVMRLPGILLGDPVNGTFVIYVSSNRGDGWIGWPNSKSARPARAMKGESLFAASNSALVVPGTDGDFAFVTGGPKGARLFNLQFHDPFGTGSWKAFSITPLPLEKALTAGAFSIARHSKGLGRADMMIVGGNFKQPDLAASSVFIPERDPGWWGLRPQKLKNPPPHPTASAPR